MSQRDAMKEEAGEDQPLRGSQCAMAAGTEDRRGRTLWTVVAAAHSQQRAETSALQPQRMDSANSRNEQGNREPSEGHSPTGTLSLALGDPTGLLT